MDLPFRLDRVYAEAKWLRPRRGRGRHRLADLSRGLLVLATIQSRGEIPRVVQASVAGALAPQNNLYSRAGEAVASNLLPDKRPQPRDAGVCISHRLRAW